MVRLGPHEYARVLFNYLQQLLLVLVPLSVSFASPNYRGWWVNGRQVEASALLVMIQISRPRLDGE